MLLFFSPSFSFPRVVRKKKKSPSILFVLLVQRLSVRGYDSLEYIRRENNESLVICGKDSKMFCLCSTSNTSERGMNLMNGD